ncbi:MAG: Lon protease-like protein [Flavobacteriales bacterium]|jgi:Lon protease-like protein
MNPSFEIPLFPLSAHLLPGGRMSLRIFEPRYVRMVKEACASDKGFGICMVNSQGDKDKNQHIYPIGTFAKVIDFDLLEDGFLGVIVEGGKCFNILTITTESDELRLGECQWIDEWPAQTADHSISPIDEKLIEIFDNYPELQMLYQNPKFNDPIWVIYRWLELLPVNVEQKQHFLQQKDCVKALEFLTQLVE